MDTVWDLLASQAHTRGSAPALLAPDRSPLTYLALRVSTVAAQGIGGYAIEASYGIPAPAGTPPEIIAKIAGALDRIRRTPAFHRRLAELGYEPVSDTPAELGPVIRADIAKYAEIIKRAAIEARREPQGVTP